MRALLPRTPARIALAGFVAAALLMVALHDWAGLGGSGLDWAVSGPLYDAVMLISAAACLFRGATSEHRGERAAWLLIGLGLGVWALGDVYWTWFVFDDPTPPDPSPADIGYLGFYPLIAAGLALLVKARARDFDRSHWLDALIAGLGSASLATIFIFDVVYAHTGGSGLAKATTLAYPLADALLIGLVVGLVALSGWRPGRTWALLAAGLAVMGIADSIYALQSATYSTDPGDWLEPLWLLAASLIALAAFQGPAMRLAGTDEAQGWRGMIVPTSFAALTVGMIAFEYGRRAATGITLALIGLTMVVIIVRLAYSAAENQRLLGEVRRDALTGLGNRGALEADLGTELLHADPALPRVLVLLDLDGFKLYNDSFGHPAGDTLLIRLSHRLEAVVEPLDGAAYRIGGDEFCVLLDGRADAIGAAIDAISGALTDSGSGFEVTSSWGAVALPEETADTAQALQIADGRMYEQKDARRASAGSQAEGVLLKAIEAREPELGEHVHQVAEMAMAVGRRLGLGETELAVLRRAAELHDIGKMAVPDSILEKTGPLEPAEREFIERHTVIGEGIVSAAPALAPVAELVRSSHERWDGSGYPDGLRGEQIPLGARIVFVCDAYNAMVTNRPYSGPTASDEAIAVLRQCAGSQFDPRVVEAACAELESRGDGRSGPGRSGRTPVSRAIREASRRALSGSRA